MTQILLHTTNLLSEAIIDASEVMTYDPVIILNVVLFIATAILSIDKVVTWVRTKDNAHFAMRKKHERMEKTVKEDNEKLAVLEHQLDTISIGIQTILKGQLMDNHTKYMTRQPEPYITDKEQKIWINMHAVYKKLGGNGVIDAYNDDIVNRIKVVYQPDEN